MKYFITFLIISALIAIGYLFFINKNMSTITYSNSSLDLIKVTSPVPGETVKNNFRILGEARGTWFFEASFPMQVLDKDGRVLFQTPAQAEGDWMTENFVPFHADIKIPETYTGPAKLILNKDNPSGLLLHDASVSFDVIIK